MSDKVKEMFASIADRYDLMNDMLSLGIHRSWRKKAVGYSSAKLKDSVLDCAAGTGDLSIEFKKCVGNEGTVTATDFCDDMLVFAVEKFKKLGLDIHTSIEDAMDLTYEDNTFDIASISFGIRNVDNPEKGLKEMARVVKSGGEVVVLEFGQAYGLFGILYKFYSKLLMPLLSKFIRGSKYSFNYLLETSGSFPCRDEFIEIMKRTGSFNTMEYHPILFGIAYIYIGKVK